MKPLKGMRTCAEEGCKARVMKHDKCEHHRPRPPREETEEEAAIRREKNRESARRREKAKRTLPGIPAGWEV